MQWLFQNLEIAFAETYSALGFYLIVMGFFYTVLGRSGISPITRPLTTALYYSIAVCVVGGFYYREIADYIFQFNELSILALVSLVVTLLLLPLFISNSKRLLRHARKHQRVYVLQIGYPYVFGKSFEIFFQQIVILVLSIRLYEILPDISSVILIFAILFSSLHIPVLLRVGVKFGMLFVCASALAALVFPVLILGLKGGFIFSYVIHWMFYIVVAFANTEKLRWRHRKTHTGRQRKSTATN